MKASVYLESSVVSYLASRRSQDPIVAARQGLTLNWWRSRRTDLDLFVSQAVVNEVSRGDIEAADRRLELIRDLPLLDVTEEAESLAVRIVEKTIVPRKAAEDALHMALATVHRIDYLVTWNCRHIANAEIQRRLGTLVLVQGYTLPVICTPEQLGGT